jgi:hypothetical protein
MVNPWPMSGPVLVKRLKRSPYRQQHTFMYCSPELLLVAELHKISHKLTTHHHHIVHTQ